MMTTNVRNMRSIVTASSAVLVALLAVVVMLSAVSGVSADKSTTTTYETTKYVDEYNSGYYGDEYKSGYYPKYKWWAPWTWKYSSNKYNDNKYDSGGYDGYYDGYPDGLYDGYGSYDGYGGYYDGYDGYPCGSYYPKAYSWKPWTWKYYKYAKYNYYTGDCFKSKCFCTGADCCPTRNEPTIRSACQVLELYKFLASKGQTPLGKACSDVTGYAEVSCATGSCMDAENEANKATFRKNVAISTNVVISAGSFQNDECLKLMYPKPPANSKKGDCNFFAWFSGQTTTLNFVESVYTFDPSNSISKLITALGDAAGVFLDANKSEVGKIQLFDLYDSGIEFSTSNFNDLISAAPLGRSKASGKSYKQNRVPSIPDRALYNTSRFITAAEAEAALVDGGWIPAEGPPFSDTFVPGTVGYQGGTFASFASELTKKAPFLNKLSRSTMNALQTLDTYEITGCPFAKGVQNAQVGDAYRVSGNGTDGPSGLMGCQEPTLCLNCDSTNPAHNDCVTELSGGFISNAVAPCDPSKCYTERWFGNIRGIDPTVTNTPPPDSDIGFPSSGCSAEYLRNATAWLMNPDKALRELNEKDAVTAVEVRTALIFLVDYKLATNGFSASYSVNRGPVGAGGPDGKACSRECWENQFFTSDVTYEGTQEYFPVAPFGSQNNPNSWNPTSGPSTCCLPESTANLTTCMETGTNCVCCDPSLSLPIQTGPGDEILIANTPENAKLMSEIVLCGPANNPQGVVPIPINGQSNSLCGE
ncbi:hypothetical protein NFJ02_28g64460 [Pycnococcus provasolii]